MTGSIYSVQSIQLLEKAAIGRYKISGDTLMARAGKAAFDALRTRFPEVEHIAVLCGGGNNGGDGYVVARLAHEASLSVRVLSVGDVSQLTNEASTAYKTAKKAGVSIEPWAGELGACDAVVDGLLGIGLQGDVRDDCLAIINTVNEAAKFVLALDVPSGVNADSGFVGAAAIKASLTMTFIGMKRGLLTGDALDHVGELMCDTLGLPDVAFKEVPAALSVIDNATLLKRLPAREKNSHKGDFGHVLVVAGNKGYSGAARMAGEAALSVGAGLVTVATHPSHANMVSVGRPELMVYAADTANALEPLLKKASVVIVGPGLGDDAWGHAMLHAAVTTECPMVVDADGLRILSEKPQHQLNWVLTPHPGEAAALLGIETSVVNKNRFESITQIQKRYGGVCVLKGAGSLVFDGKFMRLCMAGNPGMSSGGMGDVLTGVIGGLLAQHLLPMTAAQLGVVLHAKAGDLASEFGERGLLATELFPYLRELINP